MPSVELTVTLPYPPSANRYWRVVKGRPIISKEARQYRKCAAELAFASGMRPLAGPVIVRLDVYRPAKRQDLDNSLKIVLDACRGVGYVDDSQIVRIEASRFEDKHNPRIEIQVQQASDAV